MRIQDLRFTLAWSMPLCIALALSQSPQWAWVLAVLFPAAFAAVEAAVPGWHASPGAQAHRPWFSHCLRLHVLWQAGLLALGVAISVHEASGWTALAVGVAVGMTSGSQGITFAHELGHSRSRFDRVLAWLLMGSVMYAHFMVEHYRGHHVRVATPDDPASARLGESLWRFMPRTLLGSWRSAWSLEARALSQRRRAWWQSPLALASLLQGLGLAALTWAWGWTALVFWLAQAALAVALLETVNYIEHYGLQRGMDAHGQRERFGVAHAWGSDHLLSNCLVANLQRHADHHMHPSKPYVTLEALPSPRLPMGYAGCLYLAMWPWLWFRVMHPRLPATS